MCGSKEWLIVWNMINHIWNTNSKQSVHGIVSESAEATGYF
jgi:hypothetical protein